MTHEDYVSLWQAMALKSLGFDWKCETFWDNEGTFEEPEWVITYARDYPYISNDDDRTVLRPTMAAAQKWLREVKGIALNVIAHDGGYYTWDGIYLPETPIYGSEALYGRQRYPLYEHALSSALSCILELIKAPNDVHMDMD